MDPQRAWRRQQPRGRVLVAGAEYVNEGAWAVSWRVAVGKGICMDLQWVDGLVKWRN